MTTSFEQGINTLKKVIDAPIASYFSSCVNCGICSQACIFYTETDDAKYTPMNRLEPMRRLWEQEYTVVGKLKKLIGLSKEITPQDLENSVELLFESCTTCGRCSMMCPVGNDIVYMIRKMREGLTAAGLAPKALQAAAVRTLEKGSVMGFPLKTLQSMIDAAEEETGIKINVDEPNCDYLLLLSSNEVMGFNEIIGALAKIFKEAGVTWTFSSKAYEAANPGIHMGAVDVEAAMINRIVEAAEELNVKNVISPECGHAYPALRWEAANEHGKPLDFEVLAISEFLGQQVTSGKLKLKKLGKDKKITYHDSCKIGRHSGVFDEPRAIFEALDVDFKELDSHGVMNYCCGGGAGVFLIDRAAPLRQKAYEVKMREIRETEAESLMVSCGSCRLNFEAGKRKANDVIEIDSLITMVADNLPS